MIPSSVVEDDGISVVKIEARSAPVDVRVDTPFDGWGTVGVARLSLRRGCPTTIIFGSGFASVTSSHLIENISLRHQVLAVRGK